jgi:hypothetical protein
MPELYKNFGHKSPRLTSSSRLKSIVEVRGDSFVLSSVHS